MKKLLFTGTLFLTTSFNYGYIYQIHVLRTWVHAHNDYQYVIALGDWHDKKTTATHTQRAYLEHLITCCDAQNTHIIVEDLSSNNCGRNSNCGKHILNTRGGILGGFAQLCHTNNISVENVEYRYCRVASLGPALRASSIDAPAHHITSSMRMSAITQEITNAVEELRSNKNPHINTIIDTITQETDEKMEQLNLNNQPSHTVHEYLQTHATQDTKQQLLNNLLVFDSALMDAKIVENVLNNTEKTTIIILAGGTHAQRAAQLLQKLDYELVYSSTIKHIKEYNLTNCAGSAISKGRFCYRPQPINIHCIEKYIQRSR
jgi:rhodanese-related sulfurtransferase